MHIASGRLLAHDEHHLAAIYKAEDYDITM